MNEDTAIALLSKLLGALGYGPEMKEELARLVGAGYRRVIQCDARIGAMERDVALMRATLDAMHATNADARIGVTERDVANMHATLDAMRATHATPAAVVP